MRLIKFHGGPAVVVQSHGAVMDMDAVPYFCPAPELLRGRRAVGEIQLICQKTGTEEVIKSLYLLLEPYGITEFVRSGRIAIRKDIQG